MSDRCWSGRDFMRRSAIAGAVALGGPTLLSACTAVPQAGGGGGQEGGGGPLERVRQAGFARDSSHRVLMFDGGRVVEDAPPRRLFTEAGKPRTRTFRKAVLDH